MLLSAFAAPFGNTRRKIRLRVCILLAIIVYFNLPRSAKRERHNYLSDYVPPVESFRSVVSHLHVPVRSTPIKTKPAARTVVLAETSSNFLNIYESFLETVVNATAQADDTPSHGISGEKPRFCTPSLAEGQIRVEINGKAATEVAELSAVEGHQLNILTMCHAEIPGIGDFYETFLMNERYRSRVVLNPPYDGSGAFIGDPIRFPKEMIGQTVRLRAWRLYREFEGVRVNVDMEGDFSKSGPYAREEVLDIWVKITDPHNANTNVPAPIQTADRHHWIAWKKSLKAEIKREEEKMARWCTVEDFEKGDWKGGYWFRKELTDAAWHFRLPHCKTRKFTQDEASECLNGKYIGFIGDSTSQDMMRNTFWSFLGDSYPTPDDKPLPKNVLRDSDFNLTHPGHPERWTRMAMMFNGHHELRENKLGMHSLRHPRSLERHEQFFKKSKGMDTILVNSGLHDAYLRPTLGEFMKDFDFGWKYYERSFAKLRVDGGPPPQIIYRFSLTPAVDLQKYRLVVPANPSSIQTINLLEKDYLFMRPSKINDAPMTYLDSYELTWGWHFDREMNDGLYHYGRPPWDTPGVKKVADDMTVQILLNRLCPRIAERAETTPPANIAAMASLQRRN